VKSAGCPKRDLKKKDKLQNEKLMCLNFIFFSVSHVFTWGNS
jgi:hypothetical protein